MIDVSSLSKALEFFGPGGRIMIQVDNEQDLKEARRIIKEKVELAQIHDFYNMIIFENSSIINFEVIGCTKS